MIKLHNIAIRRGTQLLFEGVSQDFHDGEKLGLIGDNGSGKSSLLSLFLGEIICDQGDLSIPADTRSAHVAQQTPNDSRSALDHVLDGDKAYRKIEASLTRLEGQHNAESAELFTRMQDIDGYSAPARAAKLLSGLGFKTDQQGNPTRSFSGGWRVRINLAQALMAPSDLLLLDEPTNHLDLDAIVWLEEWLKKYPGTLIVISHDRDFIDSCCRRILHIENNQIRSYSGNYSQFERQRAERLALEQSMFAKQQKKISHMESFVRRFKYKASKAKQAQSRIKALEKMQLIIPAHVGSPFNFEFKPCDRLSDPIIKLDDIDAGYGQDIILNQVNLSIAGGDRIGLLGANGAGKSTLIKTLADQLVPLGGIRTATKHLRIGYFAQHQMEQLNPELSPMQQFQNAYPKASSQELRRFLGGFDFQGERVNESIAPFSGGEKARLALALIIYDAPNFLLLDEPTNHLDMEMRHALNIAMQSFEGAIVLVSHDRSLLNTVTDQLWLVQSGRVRPFNDDMSAYLTLLKQRDVDGAVSEKPQESVKSSAEKLTNKQRRQLQAQQRHTSKVQRSIVSKFEIKMQKLQQQIDELNKVLLDPETYENESTANLAKLAQRKSDKDDQLKQIESQWLAAAEKLEKLIADSQSRL